MIQPQKHACKRTTIKRNEINQEFRARNEKIRKRLLKSIISGGKDSA